jgi:hypothetical protein
MADDARRLVKDRLEFVSIISSLNPQFLDASLIRETDNGGWTHPWQYFDALRTYLLLTCFDVLGQPASFMDFASWLRASSTEAERTAALSKASPQPTLLEAIKLVQREYNALYGAKNAFYRFIDRLPAALRAELYYSVRIRQIDIAKNIEVAVVESEEPKRKFLYDVRNAFTHRAENAGSPAGGVFPSWNEPVVLDGVPKRGWVPIRWEEKQGFRFEYCVRDWPNVLVRVVQRGLEVPQ